jgi:hypothetical protein
VGFAMTTPDERLRALRYAEELLGRIVDDAHVPAAVRQRARDLAMAFPGRRELLAGIETPGARLTPIGAQAIIDAGVFFARIGRPDIDDEETRTLLDTVMRHYPTSRDGWRDAQHLQSVPLADFLAEEST